jgi:hypothetical protein
LRSTIQRHSRIGGRVGSAAEDAKVVPRCYKSSGKISNKRLRKDRKVLRQKSDV